MDEITKIEQLQSLLEDTNSLIRALESKRRYAYNIKEEATDITYQLLQAYQLKKDILQII